VEQRLFMPPDTLPVVQQRVLNRLKGNCSLNFALFHDIGTTCKTNSLKYGRLATISQQQLDYCATHRYTIH